MTHEATIVDACVRFFRRNGYTVRREVAIQRKFADLYCVNNGDGHCVSVEAKVRDWGRALIQAKVHQTGSDYSFVAVPLAAVSSQLRERAQAAGIGVIGVAETGKVKVVIEAKPSRYLRRSILRRILVSFGAKAGVAGVLA